MAKNRYRCSTCRAYASLKAEEIVLDRYAPCPACEFGLILIPTTDREKAAGFLSECFPMRERFTV